MKRLLMLLLTAGLTIGLTGCGPEQGEPSPQENSGVESSRPELSLPEQSYDSVEEMPDFYIQVLMMYGAVEDPETRELRPLHASLFYGDGWKDGSELTAGDAYCWFLSFVNDLSTEEMEERYASPFGEDTGWFFPAEELESTMAAWFEGVTPEQFRADSSFYDAEHHGYRTLSGPGIGELPRLELGEVRAEGDLRTIPVFMDYASGADRRMELTIRITPDQKSYRFVSWLPENAVTSAGEAEDWLTEAMQLVQIEPSATGRFTDHGLGCPLLTAEPWDDPSELEPHALLDWYLRMGLPTTSRDDGVETRIAAADFEGALEQYFTPADPAFLREQADIYDADAGEYHAPLIGGRGMGSTFWAAPLSRDGDRQTVLISGASAGGPRTKGILTLQHQDDGSARLVSWDPDRSTMG